MKIYDEFINLIKKGEYYEAHEVLEEEWQKIRKSENPLRFAYKGLINAAVALELKKRGRKNYFKVWKNFEKYKKYYIIDENLMRLSEFVLKYKPRGE